MADNRDLYMRQLRDYLGKAGQFGALEKFVFEHGTGYPVMAPTQPKPGTIKQCFKNATEYALANRLRYVEGYALGIIPVHHAWCIDVRNRVIETTWKTPGAAYIGVPFRPKRLWKLTAEQGWYGLFANEVLINVDLLQRLHPTFVLPKVDLPVNDVPPKE